MKSIAGRAVAGVKNMPSSGVSRSLLGGLVQRAKENTDEVTGGVDAIKKNRKSLLMVARRM